MTSMTYMTSNTSKTINKELAQLEELSTSVAEYVLQDDLEKQIISIPKITNYRRLEQIAVIYYHHPTWYGIFGIFWNGKHALLDSSKASWQFPDMTIRQLINYHFETVTFKDDPSLDTLISEALTIEIDIHEK